MTFSVRFRPNVYLCITMRERIFFWALAMLMSVVARSQVSGTVTDSLTNEPIPFVQIYYEGTTIGTQSDEKGRYSISSPEGAKPRSLIFSSVGHVKKQIWVKAGTQRRINVRLREANIPLDEVMVKPQRQRYSRKNNPAVELMRKVIAAKKRSDLTRNPYYSYYTYQKLTTSFDYITGETLRDGIFKQIPSLINQVETDTVTGRLIMPVMVEETVKRHIYRQNPQARKSIVMGLRSQGINDLLSVGEGMNTIVQTVFSEINIYDEDIMLFENKFISPIATHGAISFYRYFIMDTIDVEQEKCYHLTFVPNNSQDFGFTGHLYVTADSTYQVKRCTMSLPKNTGINFVDEITILQDFQRLPDGSWGLVTDDMRVSLLLFKSFQGGQVQRTTRYFDYSFEPLELSLFHRKLKEEVHADAQIQTEEFWQKHRQVSLTEKEKNMKNFVNEVRNIPGFKYVMFAVKALVENFIETGSENSPSKFDFGPVNTLISSNYIDGLRLRLSGKTTAALNPHLFFNGYVAYGFKDGKPKYKGELEYAFEKKKRLPFEYPRRSIALMHQYDVMSPSDKFLITDKDNMFLSLRSNTIDLLSFIRKSAVRFTYETDNDFSMKVELRHINDHPVGKLAYIRNDGAENNVVDEITTSEASVELRYAPGETYINSKQGRLAVNHNAPVFLLTQTMGFKGLLGGDYRFNSTELSIYKRYWLSSYGCINTTIKGGIVWDKVPFPLLMFPPSNQSFIMQLNSFHLMNNMEFLNDRYASVDLTCELNGVLLNRIPLLRKLKWREVFGIRALYGSLSDKNNPKANSGDAELFLFPQRNGVTTSYVMNPSVPYVEYHVGLYNVFKILRVEYFRRLTYLNHPDADKQGVRLMLQFTF